jgi:precorrin-3B synthase
MSADMAGERRRGWCPGVRRPMETGDGLLVRLHPFGGRLTAAQARMIAQAAHDHGNGHLDITARGNLQIRGVSDESYPGLLAVLEREGLVESEGDGPNRLTIVSPLAGLDPLERIEVLALAQAIESRAAGIEGLPAKFFVAVDGDGAMPLDHVGADLHLRATGGDEPRSIAFGVTSSSAIRWMGATSLARAADAAASILAGFAAMRSTRVTEARRLRDLPPGFAQRLMSQAGLDPVCPPPQQPHPSRAGVIDVKDGKAVLLALPFGRCSAEQLGQAAQWSERLGTGEIRLSYTRGLLLPGLSNLDSTAICEEARSGGFITDAGDPRLSLLACPGKPACAGALTQAPGDALRIAESCAEFLTRDVTIHVSGCPKGCAHPGRASLTLVGREDGFYDVLPGGGPRDAVSDHLSLEEIMTRLSCLPSSSSLRSAFPERAR